MKNKMLIKTLSLFLTTTILQLSGISAKLFNGSGIVEVNAATKSYAEKEKHIMTSVEIQGNLIEGQTLTAIVRDASGRDITKYCVIGWECLEYPTSASQSIYGGPSSKDKNKQNQYTLEKEDVGKYIKVIAEGDYVDPNAPAGDFRVATKESSITTKVETNPSIHWQKEIDASEDFTATDWYYLNDDGSKISGWKQIGGDWYYFSPKNMKMQKGWKYINGKWYYLNKLDHGEGKMLTDCWIEDVTTHKGQKNTFKFYYISSDGTMATNTTINGHYLDASGATTDKIDKLLVQNY